MRTGQEGPNTYETEWHPSDSLCTVSRYSPFYLDRVRSIQMPSVRVMGGAHARDIQRLLDLRAVPSCFFFTPDGQGGKPLPDT